MLRCMCYHRLSFQTLFSLSLLLCLSLCPSVSLFVRLSLSLSVSVSLSHSHSSRMFYLLCLWQTTSWLLVLGIRTIIFILWVRGNAIGCDVVEGFCIFYLTSFCLFLLSVFVSLFSLSLFSFSLPFSLSQSLLFFLSPLTCSDIHLIFNLVDASMSFRSAESWTPICLPKFNDTGFLHAYVSYLPNNSSACLLLLSTNKEKFFELKQCKEKIVEVGLYCGWSCRSGQDEAPIWEDGMYRVTQPEVTSWQRASYLN